MPGRTGRTTYVPGVGATTRGKGGKAKTFTGKGPAPAGTKKVAEKSYDEVPTTTVTSSGTTTSGYGSDRAAKRAVRAQKARARRVQRIVAQTTREPQKAPKPPKPYKAPDVSTPIESAIKAVSALPKEATQLVKKSAAVAAKVPEQKVTKAFGKPTLGTPKVGELVKAKKEGRLSGVRKGKVVATPQARKAKKQLVRAKKAYAKKAKPNIEGLLNEEQERFAEALSKATGLPPKLAGDWTLKESGASSAGAGGQAGEQNQLGVGYPAHPTSFSQSPYFNNTTPEKAAKATAKWMEGKIGSEYDYQAAPSIQEIPKLAKAGASDAELRSYIAGPSAWGTGEIPNSPQVTATPGKAGPKVTAKLEKAKAEAKRLGLKPGKAAGDLSKGKGRTVYVRADAKGMVQWVESALGTTEGTSKQQRWADKTGLGYTEPWCANFVSNGLARRGITNLPSNPNYVPSYEEWGAKYAVQGGLAKAKPGDLLTFSGRHIGVYVGNGEMVSGNSSDAVSRTGVDSDLSMVIRPPYKGGKVAVQESAALPGSVAVTSGSSSAPAVAGLAAAPSASGGQGQKPKLTRRQEVNRTKRKLKDLGVGVSTTSTSQPSTSTLDALEKKYGLAA